MSASIMSDSMVMSSGPDGMISGLNEVDSVICDCCGLSEECTASYIQTIRQRYGGKWICGLCGEAVKDEILRCRKLISPDEAMARHLSFCKQIRASGPPEDPTVDLIRAIRHVLRRSLESPKATRSMPSSPGNARGQLGTGIVRAESCIPSITLVEASMYRGGLEDCE